MTANQDRSHQVLLIHGGLADDMDAARFWVSPGIVARLNALGWSVLAPDFTGQLDHFIAAILTHLE